MDGRATNEGRLEILHNGTWGTVCDDRFSEPGGTHNRPLNVAPALACQMMGYAGGEYASGYGRRHREVQTESDLARRLALRARIYALDGLTGDPDRSV